MPKSKKGKHTSVAKELKRTFTWLESQEGVSRVVLGMVESARHSYSPGSLRYQMDAPGGIKLKAYGGNGVHDVYVKVDPAKRQELVDRIRERWNT